MAWQAARLGEGSTIPWKNQTGGAVAVGNVVVVGNGLGVLTCGVNSIDTSLADGSTGTVNIDGLQQLPKLSTDTWVEGARLYWDASNNRLTVTQGNNRFAGVAARIGLNGDTYGYVLLNREFVASNPVEIVTATWPDQATADVVVFNANAPSAFRVIDVLLENTAANGANANTIQVCAAAAGGSAISDAMSLNGKAAGDLVRAANIAAANASIAKNGSLYLRQTKAGGTMGGTARILVQRI